MWAVKPGDMVVCIDASRTPDELRYIAEYGDCGGTPVSGGIYTVANIYIAYDGDVMLELVEVSQPGNADWDPGFVAHRFRPVRRTDISALQTLLVTPPKEHIRG